MYTNYQYYVEEFGGASIPESSFPRAERWAEAYIKRLTYVAGDIFAEASDVVKDAVCSAAEAYYNCALRNGENGAVKSESNDGYSVSYTSEQSEGQTVEAVARKKAYEVVSVYLLPTGWMSRKVGCAYDHKCRCNNI